MTLTDDADGSLASLREGAEVTIVAWRPGWGGSTRYRVRVTDSGLEGWLPAGDLRSAKTAIALPPVAPPQAPRPAALGAGESGRSGRRPDQRF